jgi:hypothetical protein
MVDTDDNGDTPRQGRPDASRCFRSPPAGAESQGDVDRSLRFFLPGVAHDIGNALQAAGLELDLIRMAPEGRHLTKAAIERHLDALLQQFERVRALNSAIGDASMPDGEEHPAFALGHLIRQVSLYCSAALRHCGIRLEVSVDNPDLAIRGDIGVLMRTCIHLIRRIAVTAAPEQQAIGLSAMQLNQQLVEVHIAAVVPKTAATHAQPISPAPAMTLLNGRQCGAHPPEHPGGRFTADDGATNGSGFRFKLAIAHD